MKESLNEIYRYPDAAAYELTSVLAESFQLTREHFLIGNGSDQIIQMLAQAFFRPGEEILMGKPSFPRYASVARILGAIPVELPCVNGDYPLQQIAEKITSKTKAVFICNPNNPTGTALTEEELRSFMAKVPANVLVIFDEAYLEFSDIPFSGISFLSENKPVIVLRTFSKAFGLAGLRVGFAVSHPELINGLSRVRDPFNASVPALAGALAAWQDRQYLNDIVTKNRAERERLIADLSELGARVFPAHTNFIMAFFPEDGTKLGDDLLKAGIIVRPGNIFGYPDGIRITIGTREENDKLLDFLKKRYGK